MVVWTIVDIDISLYLRTLSSVYQVKSTFLIGTYPALSAFTAGFISHHRPRQIV